MKTLRTGVVGVGHMGVNHARLYSEIPGSEFAAVFDSNAENAAAAPGHRVATEVGERFPATEEDFARGETEWHGRMVRLRHPSGYESHYLHLSGFAAGLRAGERVEQGDTIGFVGSSGLSTGPHLHYELLVHQHNVDPVKYILEEYRSF